MKKLKTLCTLLFSWGLIFAAPHLAADSNQAAKQVKIGVVDFKASIEKSKLGKQEQQNFENLKKQMETVLEEKEKTLNDLATKLNDVDYLDSVTPEAETELKRKFRTLNQEISQQQAQYYQALNQANVKIIQKIQETVEKASEKVASDLGLDVILNDEGTFFYIDTLNVTDKVVAALDVMFETLSKPNPADGAQPVTGSKLNPADGAQPVKGSLSK